MCRGRKNHYHHFPFSHPSNFDRKPSLPACSPKPSLAGLWDLERDACAFTAAWGVGEGVAGLGGGLAVFCFDFVLAIFCTMGEGGVEVDGGEDELEEAGFDALDVDEPEMVVALDFLVCCCDWRNCVVVTPESGSLALSLFASIFAFNAFNKLLPSRDVLDTFGSGIAPLTSSLPETSLDAGLFAGSATSHLFFASLNISP